MPINTSVRTERSVPQPTPPQSELETARALLREAIKSASAFLQASLAEVQDEKIREGLKITWWSLQGLIGDNLILMKKIEAMRVKSTIHVLPTFEELQKKREEAEEPFTALETFIYEYEPVNISSDDDAIFRQFLKAALDEVLADGQ